MKKQYIFIFIFSFMFMALSSKMVYANNDTENVTQEPKNKIYDSLKNKIDEQWEKGIKSIEDTQEIEIKGDIMERIVRTIANFFLLRLQAIKGGSLLIGLISIFLGIILAALAKLNKSLRKFAIWVLIIIIPLGFIILNFGLAKFISVFQ